jgi:hypothetical protein
MLVSIVFDHLHPDQGAEPGHYDDGHVVRMWSRHTEEIRSLPQCFAMNMAQSGPDVDSRHHGPETT